MGKLVYDTWEVGVNHLCSLILGVAIGVGLQNCSHDYRGNCPTAQEYKYIQEVASCVEKSHQWDEPAVFKSGTIGSSRVSD